MQGMQRQFPVPHSRSKTEGEASMTTEEITAKEIGESLTGALSQLRQAKRLISERDHTIALGATELAIRETEHAIAMMRQDYANKSKFSFGDAVYFYNRRNEYIPGTVQGVYPNGDIAVDANFREGDHVVAKHPHHLFHQEADV